jgi:hypothetical protein
MIGDNIIFYFDFLILIGSVAVMLNMATIMPLVIQTKLYLVFDKVITTKYTLSLYKRFHLNFISHDMLRKEPQIQGELFDGLL